MSFYNLSPLNINPDEILVYYKGPFDEIILTRIGNFLRNQFPGTPKIRKKVFSVFIELAQNISYYSAENNIFGTESDEYGVGTVIIYDRPDQYVLTAGNLAKKQLAQQMADTCEQLNQMTPEELRALKKEIRRKPRSEKQKGGNIGLIHIALKAQSPLRIETHPSDEQYVFFSITTQVSKSI